MTTDERSTIDTVTALALLALAREGSGPDWTTGQGPLGALAFRSAPGEDWDGECLESVYGHLEAADEAIGRACAHGRAWRWRAAGSALGHAEIEVLRALPKLELEVGNYLELDDGHSPPGCCLLVHDACEDIKEQPVDAFLPADAAGLRRIARWLSAWADELDARAREGR